MPKGLTRATQEDFDAAPSGAVPLSADGGTGDVVTAILTDELSGTLLTGGVKQPSADLNVLDSRVLISPTVQSLFTTSSHTLQIPPLAPLSQRSPLALLSQRSPLALLCVGHKSGRVSRWSLERGSGAQLLHQWQASRFGHVSALTALDK